LPLAYALTGRQLFRALGLGLVLWGLPLAAAAAVVPHVAVVLLLFPIVGVGNDLVDLGAFSALPRVVPERVLPTVFGLLEAAIQLGAARGAAAVGVLLTRCRSLSRGFGVAGGGSARRAAAALLRRSLGPPRRRRRLLRR
jgi:hypothetical protein